MLGDGSCNTSTKPINVISLSRGVVAVAAGDSHTCAITASGGAKCWGSNTFGGLGNGKQDDWENAPVDVTGLTSGVAAIAPGDSHTCALTIEGGVKCWGGLNSITFKVYVLPEDVATLTSGVRSIASGGDNTCAITTEGGVKCWGKDQFRTMLDDGTLPGALPTVTFSDNPHGYDIGLQSDIIAITVGRSHICVLTSYSAVKCRGWNYYGQLGDGTLEPHSTPVVILQR